MFKKGKFDLFQKLLPCKKDKNSDIPLPLTPYTNPPSYTQASMYSHPGSKETADGLHVFCIKGYSGFVAFDKLSSPVETMGRLETLKQIEHGRHDYDASKAEAPPRPPTPSEADMKKDANAKTGESRTLTPEVPKDECTFCKGNSVYPVRKINRFDDRPLCWGCVSRNYRAEAELAWDGK